MDEAVAQNGVGDGLGVGGSGSELLARELFEAFRHGGRANGGLALIHPDAEIVPSYEPTSTLSRPDLARHISHGSRDARVVELHAQRYTPRSENQIVVEGHALIRRNGAGFEFRPAVWAMIFRDGLLYRSWSVRSVEEALGRLAGFRD